MSMKCSLKSNSSFVRQNAMDTPYPTPQTQMKYMIVTLLSSMREKMPMAKEAASSVHAYRDFCHHQLHRSLDSLEWSQISNSVQLFPIHLVAVFPRLNPVIDSLEKPTARPLILVFILASWFAELEAPADTTCSTVISPLET